LALVTVGKENIQRKKLKKAGIDSSLFSIIEVLEKRDKGPSYRKILKKLKVHPKRVLVCGDRIEIDLKPAKLLRCNTVHMKFGRGLNCVDRENVVDHEIKELKDIKKIISKYEVGI
jgi:FMN phosphatase YigB (HAD superfamily)